jgi:hypothetical protein
MHRQRGFMDEIGGMRPENVHAENPVARPHRPPPSTILEYRPVACAFPNPP